MRRHERLPVVGFLLLLAFTVGCAGTKQYATLAEAGSTYTGAVVALAERASAIKTETTSYRLLDARRKLMARRHALTPAESLTLAGKLSDADFSDGQIVALNRSSIMRARNLHDYFAALQVLAASSAPADIGAKTSSIIKLLNTSINLADGSASAAIPDNSAVVTRVMTHVNEAVLKKELTERKGTLLPALTMLDNITASIKGGMAKDLKKLRMQRYLMRVETPFVQVQSTSLRSAGDDEQWVSYRVKHLSGPDEDAAVTQLISAAERSSAQFRKVFDKMTSDSEEGYSIEELESVVEEVNQFSTIVKSFSKGE
ncbi:MAG: hypothetical protein HGB00_10620 [Chlorobiaceae bacterium]|nr:hypothetical protein [Chlorobiaceae bacterium]